MSIPPTAFEQYTVAFYNVENLFDAPNRACTPDDEATAFGSTSWTAARYQKKLAKISDAISKIGVASTGKLPSLVGLAEVATKNVLRDLIEQPKLLKTPYDFIHYDSPDQRGIGVALLYDTTVFLPTHTAAIPVVLHNEQGERDPTRDILYVSGILAGTPVHLYINHWPSRRDGTQSTAVKRAAVAAQLIQHINAQDPTCKRTDSDLLPGQSHHVLIIGDFNDDPDCESLKNGILPHGFDNVTAPLKKFHRGSLNHHFKWNLFDQILLSHSLHNKTPNSLYFYKADIFDDIFLRENKGKYRGHPARTFTGHHYKGGYSDHFPVFAIFRRNGLL